MDHDDLIKLLNQDLEMEFQSIVQYVQHVATISGAEYTSTVDELKIHLTQELAHATALAEQISFLGGEPSTQVPDITTAARLARCARSRPRPRDRAARALPRTRAAGERGSDSPTWPRRCARCSPRPRSTSATCRPRSASDAASALRSRPRGLGRGLGGVELLGDDLEAAAPEAGIGEVEADDPAQLLRRPRAAGREQLEVLRHELVAALLVRARYTDSASS